MFEWIEPETLAKVSGAVGAASLAFAFKPTTLTDTLLRCVGSFLCAYFFGVPLRDYLDWPVNDLEYVAAASALSGVSCWPIIAMYLRTTDKRSLSDVADDINKLRNGK